MSNINLVVAVICLFTGLLLLSTHESFFFALNIAMSAFNFAIWYMYLPKNVIQNDEVVK